MPTRFLAGRRRPSLAGLFGAACLCLALRPAPAQAHPHAWIDVRSTVVLSPGGAFTAIREQWLFDELYSAAVMDGMAGDSPSGKASAQDFAAMAIENLGPYDYFTKISAGGHAVRLGQATEFTGAMQGGKLLLSFTAPLAEPVDPAARPVSYAIYDPSYFIRMMHRPEQPPAIEGAAGRACRLRVVPPDPSPEDVARAYALDRGAQAEEDLGDLFAERVHIQCE
ncbi:hypothetical protein BN940_06076 [Castellaniella defragrans 65Phen]|jgi:ABC-type uncharacterized transport system substrate-binding protein|uniref:DUF1007 family protein n=2 Tax=Castellaniella defragrans TaxID=75697 RepID=W8WVW8_CASD6|nr:DUF1007 family protein [Castellaniella defragrans]KAB0615948.1 DUF1007 family protein [Castellaniella defragrans]MBB6085426.1 ABC-type uncharacterized transport system substrate-binding protein [Castellaniella defragrans]CDM23684.1 hypothetical protein BN940_06076 [Castellaniella defragrans 65Phen]